MQLIRRIVAQLGAWFIYALVWLFGRTRRWRDMPWLAGPLGAETIGDAPYREVAAREQLALDEHPVDGGLVPDFAALGGPTFDPARVHPLVREFYEHTSQFAMDVWSKTFFPTSLALALLVTTISRQVDQLNFPLSPLDTARGMTSRILLLRRADGSVRYTGWYRTLAEQRRTLYTGFYMVERAPDEGDPCVKVVFPMPRGNATVVLRPGVEADGTFTLDSSGRRFGTAGFYRVQRRDDDRARVWFIRTLREHFRVYVDAAGTLRCDHTVRFLGLRVLALHYKISRVPTARSESAATA